MILLLLYCSKRSNSECHWSEILERKRRRSPLFSNGFWNFNYWAWVIKLKSCLQIVMPFAVANDGLNISPHRCTRVHILYTWLAVVRPGNNGLDCYLVSLEVWKCSAFDRSQGFRDKANFTGKMASRRDGFWGIQIPGFFCPAGTYGMYVHEIYPRYGPTVLLWEPKHTKYTRFECTAIATFKYISYTYIYAHTGNCNKHLKRYFIEINKSLKLDLDG